MWGFRRSSSRTLQQLQSLPHEITRRLRSVSSEQDVERLVSEQPQTRTVIVAVMDAIKLLVESNFVDNPDALVAARRVVTAHPELLTDEAEALLNVLAEKQPNDRNAMKVLLCRELVAMCRQVGIKEAFASVERGRPGRSESAHDLEPDWELGRRRAGVESEEDLRRLIAARHETLPLIMAGQRLDPSVRAELLQLSPEVAGMLERLTHLPTSPEEETQRLELFERALAAIDRQRTPQQWAVLLREFGTALRQARPGNHAQNIERAIAALNTAIEVLTSAGNVAEAAVAQASLGAAMRARLDGDPVDNLGKAIDAYTAALDGFPRDTRADDWAGVQNNLGTLYRARILGQRADNVERAITHFETALTVYDRARSPEDWALVQTNLGNALRERKGDPAKNIERAIAAYRAALEVRTKVDHGPEWASTQHNLGNALSERLEGVKRDNLDDAIKAYTAALEVRTREAYPAEWGQTQRGLAATLVLRVHGDREENTKRAISAFEGAIEVARAAGRSADEGAAATGLGILYHNRQRWPEAYDALRGAAVALEQMRSRHVSEEGKTRLADENAALYAALVDTCLHLERSREAIEWAEAGKARLFLDQLGQVGVPLPELPPGSRELVERETTLVGELAGLECTAGEVTDETRRRGLLTEQRRRRDDLETLWTRLSVVAPDYVALRRGERVDYPGLQAFLDHVGCDAALIEFCTLPDRIAVWVLRSHKEEPVVVPVPLSHDQLVQHVEDYRREVWEYGSRGDTQGDWQELGDLLLGRAWRHLQGAELVFVVPHGLLHYLPLHALRAQGRQLIDDFPIAYAPSSAVLKRVAERAVQNRPAPAPERALVLGYTPRESERAVFEGEAHRVAERFHTTAHVHEHATRALLQQTGGDYDVLHLSCHGFFDSETPLASGLLLADGVLTARDIMALKLKAHLVTLSACHSATSARRPGDDLVGLTRAVLYAGASSVLATLWSVEATSASELMCDFYARRDASAQATARSGAAALQSAIVELRKRQDHPYYWAPFTLIGHAD